jgi:23S rRNA pseudouridine1911/1915/1917 synthase
LTNDIPDPPDDFTPLDESSSLELTTDDSSPLEPNTDDLSPLEKNSDDLSSLENNRDYLSSLELNTDDSDPLLLTLDESRRLILTIDEQWAGRRLDHLLVNFYPELSRTSLSKSIRLGLAKLDGKLTKPNILVREGQKLVFKPQKKIKRVKIQIEDGDPTAKVSVIHQDDSILILNKPAGLVVHPSPTHTGPTLTDFLLALDPELAKVNVPDEPGLVHRLDKDTTGVMVVARDQVAHDFLRQAFADRQVDKLYLAFVTGKIPDSGKIDTPIGRHPTLRYKMLASLTGSREARTLFKVIRRFPKTGVSLVAVTLLTGRTHQARVHLSSIGAPVLADFIYGSRHDKLNKKHPTLTPLTLRHFLHARRITIPHPDGGRQTFHAPWPADFQELLNELLRIERSEK